jgi:6,7-dimethyl-8-ribityllumazine synthase
MSGAVERRAEADATGLRIGVVAARFHAAIVDALVDGALDEVARLGGDPAAVEVVRVPGAFEIPVVLGHLATRGGFDALVALACVVRGDTPHFDHVCTAVTIGCEAVARTSGVPVGFGVLTVDDEAQAWARAGGAHGNKGAEAVQAAVETARVLGRP